MGGVRKYRKKPVDVEAIQWTGENVDAVLDFCFSDERWKEGLVFEEAAGGGIGHTVPTGELSIPTLEGDMTASAGDFIIRGIQGELYPCKPDIFDATYELVEGSGLGVQSLGVQGLGS